jgi:hypothetical protein
VDWQKVERHEKNLCVFRAIAYVYILSFPSSVSPPPPQIIEKGSTHPEEGSKIHIKKTLDYLRLSQFLLCLCCAQKELDEGSFSCLFFFLPMERGERRSSKEPKLATAAQGKKLHHARIADDA